MGHWIVVVAAGILLLDIVFVAAIIEMEMRRKKRQGKQGFPAETEFFQEPETTSDDSIFQQFLPLKLLEVMGIQDVFVQPADILTEQKELQAVILNENIADFQDLVHDMEIKEIYQLVNQSLSFSIPVAFEKNGMIDRFQNAGIEVLFTGEAEDGLDAAITICEEVIRLGNRKKYRNFAIGLCYGKVSAGVVGYGKKLSVLTLSPYIGLGEFLQKKAPKYYARILAAGSYLEKVEGFEKKYNHRFLGLFYIRDTGRTEKIFDVFDGDEAGIRNQKRKTRMLFEKGVKLFIKRQFAKSRGYFIEVLKADCNDKAAREYVFLCDSYSSLSPEQAKIINIYIESC